MVYRVRFRTKLMVIFLLTTMVQGVAIGLFSYTSARDIVYSNKQQDMCSQLNLVDININVQVRYFSSLIEHVADSEVVRTLLRGGRGEELNRMAVEYFGSTHNALGSANHIMLANSSQVLLGRFPDGRTERQRPVSGALAQVVRQAMAQTRRVQWHGLAKSLVAGSTIGQQVVLISCPVYGGPRQEPLGVVLVELDTQTFGNVLLNTGGTFQNEYTFVVDKENRLVCSNKMVDAAWVQAVGETFDSGTRRFYAEWSGTRYYVCGQYNGVTGWRSFSVLSMGYLAGQAGPLRRFILLCILVCTGAVSAVIVAVSYTMTRPVAKLTRAMETVQSGDFSVRLHTGRRDEMGGLMDSFDFMTEKINTLICEVYEEKIAQQNAEMEALQTQINPHFLYNTLDSINWMLIDRGQQEVSEVIVCLGDLMKYAVDTENPVVRLEEELRYIQSYLRIQKTRMEDGLAYQIDIPEALYAWPVPRLILQPLVENCLLHGLLAGGEGNLLTICAAESGGELRIEIADNGRGIAQQQLADMKKTLASGIAMNSIGIYNVNKRLRLRYGDAYGLLLDSAPGRGTRVVMRIPKNGQERERA